MRNRGYLCFASALLFGLALTVPAGAQVATAFAQLNGTVQ